MGNSQGWIRLHRQIMNTPEWLAEPFTRSQAWVDLLLLANHETGYIRKRGILIAVERGCIGYSERSLAERWQWSRNKVRNFLAALTRLSQVSRGTSEKTVPKNTSVSSLIYIVNYDKYQTKSTEDDTEEKPKIIPEQRMKRMKRNNISPEAEKVLSYLNEKTGKRYRITKHIEARLNEGRTVEDCRRVIDTKIIDPYFIVNPKYLNPETLFRLSNFDKYLNESPTTVSDQNKTSAQDSSCPRCRAQVPPQDRTDQGCIHCEGKAQVRA